MAGIQSTNSQAKKESHLRALYGDRLPRSTLLRGQLQERTYFDSGDYALAQAHKPTNIGEVKTGTEHPLPRTISHPSSAVPASSNVSDVHGDMSMCDQQQSTGVKNESKLHEQVSQAQTQNQDVAKKCTN